MTLLPAVSWLPKGMSAATHTLTGVSRVLHSTHAYQLDQKSIGNDS